MVYMQQTANEIKIVTTKVVVEIIWYKELSDLSGMYYSFYGYTLIDGTQQRLVLRLISGSWFIWANLLLISVWLLVCLSQVRADL